MWTSSIINAEASVRPIPTHDVKAFDVPGTTTDSTDAELGRGAPTAPAGDADADVCQREVVVMRVESMAVPPCVTRTGQVFVRVSGQTRPASDQRVLMDLIEKGQTARKTAEDAAMRAAKRLLADRTFVPGEMNLVAVGFCAVTSPEDRGAVIFDGQFSERYFSIVGRDMRPAGQVADADSSHMRQDALYVHAASAKERATTVAAFWDGAVGAVYQYSGDEHDLSFLETTILQYWRGLAGIAAHYRGSGDAHLAVAFNEQHRSLATINPDDLPVTDIRRWTTVSEPTVEQRRSVALELRRAFGQFIWAD